jgi:predicted permease
MVRLPLELLPCLLLGVVLAMGLPWLPGRLAPPLIRWGMPLSLAALLLRSPLSPTLMRVGLLGLLVPLLSLLIVALPPLRRRLQEKVLLLGAALGNTGYWGLPVALALLPPQALAAVIAYDLAGTVITWGVGPLVLRGGWGGRERLLQTLWASPALQGFAICALLGQTPWHEALANLLWWPARLVFLIALTLVGMRLGVGIKERKLVFSGGVPWALACKLLGVPVLVWLLAAVLRLPPLDRQALVLQGAAPTALSVLLMAEAEREAVPLASTMVLVSTLAALVTVPLWWSVMR